MDNHHLNDALLALGVDPNDSKVVEFTGKANGQNIEPFPEKNAAALETALAILGVQVRWNLRAYRAEHRSENSKEWAAFNDRSEADLQERIASQFTYRTKTRGESALHYGSERWKVCLNALLHVREADPFKEWLEQCAPASAWDGTPRIDSILIDLFGCEDTPFTRWAGRFIFLGALLRTREPGAKLDEFPILIGPQGIGKSSLCQKIFPDEKFAEDWFSDGVRLHSEDKEKVEAMRGAVLVEFSELAGINKADQEHLKTFVTRLNDGTVRMAYARQRESMPRQCIFIGTTNVPDCLPNDPSGNRRFIPVECPKGSDIEEYMQKNRTQLWAEAQNRTQERANLPRELLVEQRGLAAKHRARDVLAEEFVSRLDTEEAYLLQDILERFEPPRELTLSGGSRRLTAALKVKGWVSEQATENGIRGRYWKYRK